MSVDINKLPEEAKHYRQGLLKIEENLNNLANATKDKNSDVHLMTEAILILAREMLLSGDLMAESEQERGL